MKARTAACPACGGPVEFKVASTLVTICPFCQSAVARNDKKIEDHGKVADLVETNSPLRLGISGFFRGKRFTILGRVQYNHPAGGVWNEWYLSFSGEKWGWLAEAQGRFYLMFERQLSSSIRLPAFGSLRVGESAQLGRAEFTVSEVGVAKTASAEGDIPWNFVAGHEHRFADLAGAENTLATFEYGDRNVAYVGKEIRLAELDLDDAVPEYVEAKLVSALQLNCPKCGGPLSLHVPDQSQRITCDNCHSLLDVSDGKLLYFSTLKTSEKLPIKIPLGSEGELMGDRYTVIGFLRRFALYEGKTYPWSEYLLYNHEIGFRWLIENQNHWAFAEPISANVKRSGSYVKYDGDSFRLYDRGTAYVQNVLGEFYWRVEAGEQVQTADYIAPPRMISFETSDTGRSQEINLTLSTYLKPETVEKAFGVGFIGRSWGVGPIQPRPEMGVGFFLLWPAFGMAIFCIFSICSMFKRTTSVDPWMMFYALLFVSIVPIGALIYMYSYEVKRWENSDYSPYRSSE
ncbi:DUF4178 domain-containing protein [Rubripirellula amarantea]|nr:DUF4178 domain-containing protein [Rubripirellula amarantea]